MTTIIIPMAGLGQRFKSEGFDEPKPLIKIEGKTLIRHSVSTLGIRGKYIFITRKFDNPKYNKLLSEEFSKLGVEYEEIILDNTTSGAVETCLAAVNIIDKEDELIITNCDQDLSWDANSFMNSARMSDGCVVTHSSSDIKNSFCKLVDGKVVDLAEKKAISDIALVGIHYWKKAKDFIDSAHSLMRDFTRKNKPECYISETYNYLISSGSDISNYHLEPNQYSSLGTPADVKKYLGKIKEFYSKKPSTIFIDLDGTIVKHCHKYSDINKSPKLLSGVRDALNCWDSFGHTIIIVTARKESSRKLTEKMLEDLLIPYDQLIMGITSGARYLINDKLHQEDKDRAIAINQITNVGITNKELPNEVE